MRRRTLLLLAVLFSFGFAPAPFLPRPRKPSPLDELQGSWFESSGNIEMRFNGGRLVYYQSGKPTGPGYRVKVNPSTSPRQFDIHGVGTWAGYSFLAIYKVEGDTLTLRMATGGSPRPAEFGPGPSVLKRLGPKLKERRR
jgi:uncharacterized protein (TIGR03067 family)